MSDTPGRFAGIKLVEGPSTLIDGVGAFSEEPWIYHFAPRSEGGALIADHPWDNSFEAVSCEYCEGLFDRET
jgi:hypothetical protein